MFTGLAYAMGPAAQGGGQGQGGGIMGFLPLILIFVIFYFLMIRPQQKKAKEHKAMLDSLKKGDKVVTSGGIYGLVEEVRPNTITLKVAENVKIRFGRGYIAGLQSSEDE
ncbi:MAG: preprotein translocase subunit YajC [Nitrospiraceae bacterium]|nr:preprotein translocase subunit YajC [Nitrospiraceae bacterium]